MVACPTGNTNPDGGGNYIDEDCNFIAVVDSVENFEHDEQSPRLEVKFRIECSDKPRQVGKTRDEKFYLSPKAIGRFLELACATGLYNKPQWKADVEAGIDANVDENELVGRYFAGRIAMKPPRNPKPGDENKLYPDLGFNIFGIGDEEADEIPLDPEIAALFPDGLQTKAGTLRKRPPAGGAGSAVKKAPPPKPPVRPAATRPPVKPPHAAPPGAGGGDLF